MKTPLTLSACLLSLVCQGQELLPRIGFAMNNATFPSAVIDFNGTFINGFLTGLEYQIPINDQFGVTSDLLFVQKGYRVDFEFDGTGGQPSYTHLTQKLRVNYADLLCMPTFKWSNLYFMAGPGISYGLFGNSYYALTDTNGQLSTRNSKVYFKEQGPGAPGNQYINQRFALTGVAAAGITLWDRLLVDLRYQITPTQYPYPTIVESDKHDWYHSIQLTTGLRLRRSD